MADVNNPIANLSIEDLMKLAENPIDQYRSDSAAASKRYEPYREGLGSFSQFLDKGLALPFYAGKQISGGISDALGFGSEFFGKDKLAARLRQSADIDQADASALLNKGLTGSVADGVSNIFSGPEAGIDDSLLNERFMDFVPTAGFEGGVEQEMSTEEAMMGMPAPVGGMSNAERVQAALFGATPAFEKSGRGKAPVKEERFFTGEGKPKPGEMMDTDFLRNPDLTAPGTEKAMEDTFKEAILDTAKAKGETVTPETQEDLLEKYKKEFYDATGLDSSGKVDKSAALMALGLSLMQNKAGKGFNVGKMLSAVGEAGEKALPELTKAKNKAEAASLAAGKYALGQIKAGESSKSAFAKEVRTNNFNYLLQKMELEEKFKIEKLKQTGKSNEMKNVSRISIGAGDLKIGMGNVDGVSKFSTAPTDAGKIVNAYNKYTEGQVNITQMQDALTALANRTEGPLPAKIIDSIKTFSVKLGLADPKAAFGEKGISASEEFEVYQQATINAFKKLILQESQISNLDLTTLFESFGNAGFMASPEKSKLAIDKMMDYFSAKKKTLQPTLNDFSDRDFFRSDLDFKKTQKKLEAMGLSFAGQAKSDEGGRLTIDLSSIPKLNSDN